MSLTIVTKPTVEPVSIDMVKQHSRITTNDDNAYLLNLIKAAVEDVEDYTRRALITQTWDWKMDGGLRDMRTPKGKLQSVSSISYIDDNGDSQTLSSSVYTVDTDSEPGRIVLAYDQTWPTTRDVVNNVTVRIVVGYGGVTAVPKGIVSYILNLVDHCYEHRTPVSELSLANDPVLNKGDWLWRYRVDAP